MVPLHPLALLHRLREPGQVRANLDRHARRAERLDQHRPELRGCRVEG